MNNASTVKSQSLQHQLIYVLSLLVGSLPTTDQLSDIAYYTMALGYDMNGLRNLHLMQTDTPLYTSEMMSHYWEYIDDHCGDVNHPENSVELDVSLMENTLLPTEAHFLLFNSEDEALLAKYKADKAIFKAFYAPTHVVYLFEQ